MTDERAIRWQMVTITQLGYALNLIVGLTVASIGYWFFLLRQPDFPACGPAKWLMVVSLACLFLSAIFGLWCVVNRLMDFRGTAKRARESADAPTKQYLDKLGVWTWNLFRAQLVTFGTGVLFLGAAVLVIHGHKLI